MLQEEPPGRPLSISENGCKHGNQGFPETAEDTGFGKGDILSTAEVVLTLPKASAL